MVKNLPIQFKSALFKDYSQVADQITVNLQSEKNNPSFYSKLKIDYCLIKKVEYLQKYSNNQEVWAVLDEAAYNKLKQDPANLNIICRLSNYSSEFVNESVFEEFNIPVFNEYFLINLENTDTAAQEDDKMLMFKDYNVKTQEINTIDPVEESNYQDNVAKMMEIF